MPDFDYCHCVCKLIFFLKHAISFLVQLQNWMGISGLKGFVLKLQNSSHGVVVISKLSLYTHTAML